jgi:hypothetical protein
VTVTVNGTDTTQSEALSEVPTQTSYASVLDVVDLVPANSTVVTMAWLRTIPGLESIVSTVLPDPANTDWASTGFVTVTTGSGGTAHTYYPERQPVMTVHGWATNTGGGKTSKKLPKGKAASLIERVVAATYGAVPAISLGSVYKPVYIEFVEPVFEIGEVPEPHSNFAHYSIDIRIGWIEQQPVG